VYLVEYKAVTVCWKSANISEEHIASIFRVEEQAEQETTNCLLHAGFLLGLLFDPEDEGDMLVWKVG
jgi:hypothetical protein